MLRHFVRPKFWWLLCGTFTLGTIIEQLFVEDAFQLFTGYAVYHCVTLFVLSCVDHVFASLLFRLLCWSQGHWYATCTVYPFARGEANIWCIQWTMRKSHAGFSMSLFLPTSPIRSACRKWCTRCWKPESSLLSRVNSPQVVLSIWRHLLLFLT